MAILAEDEYDVPEQDFAKLMGEKIPFEEWPEYKYLEHLRQASLALPDDEVVGSLLSWQVADGFAYYVVVEEDPLTVKHVPVGDGWNVNPILIKGLDSNDVMEMRRRDRALNELFGGRA